jgi:SAM-dependent methyltransferase
MVHEAASAGFGRAADAYERGRPQYPAAAVDWLGRALCLSPGDQAIDVGAGTGRLSAALVERGARVLAVEPVAAMRERLAAAIPAARAEQGTAERIPAGDGCAGAVVAAQAFHWFATDAALSEFHRVLADGGCLGLIWNRRDLDDPLQAAISALLEPLRGDAPRHASGEWRRPLEASTLFEPTVEHEVDFVQELDRAGLIDRVASTSFVAALAQAPREELLGQAASLLGEGEIARLRYVCESFVYRRLP